MGGIVGSTPFGGFGSIPLVPNFACHCSIFGLIYQLHTGLIFQVRQVSHVKSLASVFIRRSIFAA